MTAAATHCAVAHSGSVPGDFAPGWPCPGSSASTPHPRSRAKRLVPVVQFGDAAGVSGRNCEGNGACRKSPGRLPTAEADDIRCHSDAGVSGYPHAPARTRANARWAASNKRPRPHSAWMRRKQARACRTSTPISARDFERASRLALTPERSLDVWVSHAERPTGCARDEWGNNGVAYNPLGRFH
jgi:hypothetical protein